MTFEENIGKMCVINSEIRASEDLNHYTGDEYTAFYEVIRVIKGTPLFYDDHYNRLRASLEKARYTLNVSRKELKDQIVRVCNANMFLDCNIKVMILQQGEEQVELIFINKFYYPCQQEFDEGVDCCTIRLKRKNPNIKMIHVGYKEEIKRITDQKKVFEALLVDDNGKITEGSKSNVFFVKNNQVFTSPEDYILKGITRQYVIDVCRNLGYEVIETLIGIELLSSFDSVFITGTSIKVLPVRRIDEMLFDSPKNPVTQHILSSYNSLIMDYVKEN